MVNNSSNKDIPYVILDTNLFLLKLLNPNKLSESENLIFKMAEEGKIKLLMTPITYSELKYIINHDYVNSDLETLINKTFKPQKGKDPYLFLMSININIISNIAPEIASIAADYSFNRTNREKTIPIEEYNDRLLVAMASYFNIPLISADNHVANKLGAYDIKKNEQVIDEQRKLKIREQIKSINSMYGLKDAFPPMQSETFIAGFERYTKLKVQHENLFTPIPSNKCVSKGSGLRPTYSFVENYRDTFNTFSISESKFFQNLNHGENYQNSLVNISERLKQYYNKNAKVKTLEQRIKKISDASEEYMLTLTSLIFQLMQQAMKTRYTDKNNNLVENKEELKNLAEQARNYGFYFNFEQESLKSISYDCFTFELCQNIAGTSNFEKVNNILNKKIKDPNSFKLDCIIDYEKMNETAARVLIPFGIFKTNERHKISKVFAEYERAVNEDLISNEELIELVDKTNIDEMPLKLTSNINFITTKDTSMPININSKNY